MFLCCTVLSLIMQGSQPDTTISVHPAIGLNRISPRMYGTCIEDVNHEIYGGLAANRIFGEGFEEPPLADILGWSKFGGAWSQSKEGTHVKSDAGAKLVRDNLQMNTGTVSGEIRFDDDSGDSAAIICSVSNPRTGADSWIGYEVGINIRNQTVFLGRHQNNWKFISAAPINVRRGIWQKLTIKVDSGNISIFAGESNKSLIEYRDENPLPKGSIGIRTWNSAVTFRNITVEQTASIESFLLTENNDAVSPKVSGMWDPIHVSSGAGEFNWISESPFENGHSQRIVRKSTLGLIGISNSGLNRWGIAYRAGDPMSGSAFFRADQKLRVEVALESSSGTRLASKLLNIEPGGWKKTVFELTPTTTVSKGRFAIHLISVGTLDIDNVYLSETGNRLYKKLPVRADIVDMLKAGGIRFMRYGGSMVNAAEYRWKNMIGDPDQRPHNNGWWYPQSSNRFGITEFVKLCETAKIEPAVAINIDETPEDMADMVDYLTGPASTAGGARRIKDGHPKPYPLEMIEIGNEEAIDGNKDWYRRYLERFKILYEAMHKRNPSLKFVIAAWWRSEEPLCKQIAQELNGKADFWDVHVGGDGLNDGNDVDRTMTQMQQLFGEWIPKSKLKAVIFEENGGRHDLQRALGHAKILNVTQRHGDFVLADCPANCLQPLGQNDNGWDQGQIFFTPDKCWGMPPYYSQKMASENHLPICISTEVNSNSKFVDVISTKSEDGKEIVVKIVNTDKSDHLARLSIPGFSPVKSAKIITLSGELTDKNTPNSPTKCAPKFNQIESIRDIFQLSLPPYSYTIVRIKHRIQSSLKGTKR